MLLPVLHFFNDGYLAAMPLILPFASEEFALSLGVVGLLGSLLSFSGIILAIPAGVTASKFGALRLLSIGVLFYSLGFLILGLSSGVITVVLAFIIASIAFGIFHPLAFSAVAKASQHSSLGRQMGVFAATGDIGRIAFAAAVTFIIGLTSWRFTSLLYAAAAAALFIFSIFLSRGKDVSGQANNEKGKKKIDAALLKNSTFMLANASSLLDAFANSSLFIFIPFLLTFRGIDAAFIGPFTSIFFIGNLSGKVIMGRLTDRIGQERLFICCEVFIFISLIMLALSPSVIVISALAFILGFFSKGTVPITSTMIAQSVGNDEYESAYSVNSLSTSIANTVAPLFFGVLADFLGVQAIFFACAVAALCAASLLISSGFRPYSSPVPSPHYVQHFPPSSC